jgi:stage III sporulation protein AC
MGFGELSFIFTIAIIGIVVASLHTLLKQAGKDDIGFWLTVAGFVLVLGLVVPKVADLFNKVKSVFNLY